MNKFFLFIFLFSSFLHAKYEIIENENFFVVKTTNLDFQETLYKLKDEIAFEGFTIVYELNLAKATNEVATLLEKKTYLKNGINLGICKASFTYEMIEENFNNINYCPLGLSFYENLDGSFYISFKKYKTFKEEEKIANKINEVLKGFIFRSLD